MFCIYLKIVSCILRRRLSCHYALPAPQHNRKCSSVAPGLAPAAVDVEYMRQAGDQPEWAQRGFVLALFTRLVLTAEQSLSLASTNRL